MITQSKDKRIKNFNEVALGFSKKYAVSQARKFPQPTHREENPHCPLGVDISEFIRILREGDVAGALAKIREENEFPSICGRICSAPCEKDFLSKEGRKPFGIRALERYTVDQIKQKNFGKKFSKPIGKKIAIIGSGPSGLYAGFELAKLNYQVTIFEAFPEAGGVLRYGMPVFRLPRNILNDKISEMQHLGVEFKTNMFIGNTLSLEEIFSEGFEAILLAVGRGCPEFSTLKGSGLEGIYYAQEFFQHVQVLKNQSIRNQLNMKLGERVAILGSSSQALDCARIAVRLGLHVTIISEGTEEDLNVCAQDRNNTGEEGVNIETSLRPLEFLGNEAGLVKGIQCVQLDYADPKSSGKWELHPVPETESVLEVDSVIIAGTRQTYPKMASISTDLRVHDDGAIIVDEETSRTSVQNIYAAGSLISEKEDIIDSFLSGKRAAFNIHDCLKVTQ